MSKLTDFSKKVAGSAELTAEYKKILEDNKIAPTTKLADFSDSTIEALVAFAKKEGFDFTVEEVKNLAKDNTLSDDELEVVAGGNSGTCVMGGK